MKIHERNRPSIAIIGGGLGGLIAANHLADVQLDAVVFESSARFGGRAQSKRFGGAYSNMGPHALYLTGEFAETLRGWKLIPDGGDVAEGVGLSASGTAPLPTGAWTFVTSDLLPGLARVSFLRAAWAVVTSDPSLYHEVSARAWLERVVGDERVVRVMEALTRLSSYCADLERMPAELMLSQLKLAMGGVRYVHGGWQTVVDSLASRARDAGVDIRTSSPVRAVEPLSHGAIVRADEGPVRFDAVVFATGPRTVDRLLAAPSDIATDPNPVEAACLDLVLSRWRNSNEAVAVGIDKPVYVSNHSHFADFADDGRQVVHAAKYLVDADRDTAEASREQLEEALDRVAPGWRADVVEARFLPRMTVVQHLPSVAEGGRRSRPRVDALGQDRIFLAGDWVGPTGWLADAVAASAREAAMRAMTEIRSQPHVA